MSDLLHDPKLLRQILRRRLLRSAIRAVGVLGEVTRGKCVDPDALRAANALLSRLSPKLIGDCEKDDSNQDTGLMAAEFWTVEKTLCFESVAPYPSRERAAADWRLVFDKNGPREGLFETRQEAAEYGRKRFDNYEKNRAEQKRRYDAGERNWSSVY